MSLRADLFDVVVVGAGSAGCVVAERLSTDGSQRVLLLEAGPDYPSRDRLPWDIADATLVPDSHDWAFIARSDDDREQPVPRGRIVGGSSAINGAGAVRGAPDDPLWRELGQDPDAMLDEFCRLERDLDFGFEPFHGSGGPVPIWRYPNNELSVTARSFLHAADAAGHPVIEDLNRPEVLGAGPLPMNVEAGVRMSAALTHLEPARGRPNLVVQGGATVDRVEFEDGRATGVRLVDGETVGADLVVLSAGTYASPAILLRSGIGPSGDLDGLGIGVIVDLPGVGQHLQDHPRVSIDVPWRPESGFAPEMQTLLCWASDGGDLHDLELFPAGPFPNDDGGPADQVLAFNVALVAPCSTGELRLASPDPTRPPRIRTGHVRDPADLGPFVAGVLEARRLLATEPLASLVTGPAVTPELATAQGNELRSAIRRSVQSYHQPVGTCRTGPDPDDGAVVDPEGFVHGVENLVVADASVIPTSPRANLNLPTMVLAQLMAERLVDRP